MQGIFLHIYDFFEKHRTLFAVLLCLTVGLLLLSAFRIQFVEDIGRFLPNSQDNQRVNEAYQHLGGDNKFVISITMADTAKEPDKDMLTSAADRVSERLSDEDTLGLIKQILSQVDDSEVEEVMLFVLENLPYFLTEEDYARMDTMLSAEHIDRQMSIDRQMLSSPVPMMRPMVQHDPLFFSSRVLQSLSGFKMDERYQTDDGYLFSRDGKEAQVVITSNYPLSETQFNGKLIHLIDHTLLDIEQEFGGSVHLSCFGASQVSLTNSTQIKRDSIVAIALSLVLILALLLYYYRNVRSIFMILVTITFGGLFALGVIALVKHTVSVIAIGVASIILGIAINYPIHFLSHFKRTDDKRRIIKEIVNPLLIGNITTVGAFLSLLFISSDAMRDLGLFAALLLVGTIVFVLVCLPHLMGKQYVGGKRDLAFRRVAEYPLENVKGMFWIILALTILFYVFSSRTSFDTNMHHINYMTKEQQAAFDKLRAESDTTVATVYCIAEGRTLEEALRHHEEAIPAIARLQNNGAVRNVSGIGGFLPSQETQRQRITRWNQFWQDHKETFITNLDAAALRNGFTPEAFAPCKEIITHEFTVQHPDYFEPIREKLCASYIVETGENVMVYNMLHVLKDSCAVVEGALGNIHGDIFAFTESSLASRLVKALSHDFDYVLYICGIIVFAFLLFSFGKIEISIMAFLPLFVAWIWILGIMGMTGIYFNIVNVILATFIFGMGDDYSIFVTEGLLYENAYGRKMLAQFKNSIILSASIMFISIGMLVFAKHPAMRSLAEVTIIGMFSVVLMAYIIPPLVFKMLTKHKGSPRRQPVTLGSLFCTLIGFPYFFFGVLVLAVCGFFLLVLGGRSDKHKLQYHKVLRKMMLSTARIIPNSSFKILNPLREDFEKPAVIVCNHQSHFDLLYSLLLTPKMIVLTNDWAWNMPLYRRILRNADFLPTSFGVDNNLPKIQQMVEKGYSVLVFPEGTRSPDKSILRFHQGAFYLADKLGLDILPIVMHGVGDMFPKYDTFIHRGRVTISIGERISPDDETYRRGFTNLEVTRNMRQYYIKAYEELRNRCEDAEYQTYFVKQSYIYKGKDIELSCRRKLQNKSELLSALETLPEQGRLLYKHCGNGELSLLAALLRRHWDITAYDADEDSIAIASNCASVPQNLSYTTEMPDEATFDLVIDEKNLLE